MVAADTVFNVWTIYPQFSSEVENPPVTHLNIFPKLYLVLTKLILSDINIHKHRNIRNTPGDRKQSFPAQLFKIKRQSSPTAMTAFTEPLSSGSDPLTKRSIELKEAKDFSVKPILIYWVFISQNALYFFFLLLILQH